MRRLAGDPGGTAPPDTVPITLDDTTVHDPGSPESPGLAGIGPGLLVRAAFKREIAWLSTVPGSPGRDDVDPHLGELANDVIDLLPEELRRGQHHLEFVTGDIASPLGEPDHAPQSRIAEIEEGAGALS